MEAVIQKATIHNENPLAGTPEARAQLNEYDNEKIEEAAKEKLPRDVRKLHKELRKTVKKTIRRYKKTYPFLKSFGKFKYDHKRSFDEHALKVIVLRYRERLERRGDLEVLSDRDETRHFIYDVQSQIRKAYELHINAYTGMFEDLDEKSCDQEVFLGRDGMYMYYGRYAQLQAREKQSQQKLDKKVVLLNFPTHFKTTLSVEETREYLADHGVTSAEDLVFVDTGYTGSIPHHILQNVFGIEDEDKIDEKILLITSNSREHRQSQGARRRGGEGGSIESSPKPHGTAQGVYRDMESGKIQPFAQPLNPRDFFMHDCIQYLCMRHFSQQGAWERKNNRRWLRLR